MQAHTQPYSFQGLSFTRSSGSITSRFCKNFETKRQVQDMILNIITSSDNKTDNDVFKDLITKVSNLIKENKSGIRAQLVVNILTDELSKLHSHQNYFGQKNHFLINLEGSSKLNGDSKEALKKAVASTIDAIVNRSDDLALEDSAVVKAIKEPLVKCYAKGYDEIFADVIEEDAVHLDVAENKLTAWIYQVPEELTVRQRIADHLTITNGTHIFKGDLYLSHTGITSLPEG